jgi:hypothetical protein
MKAFFQILIVVVLAFLIFKWWQKNHQTAPTVAGASASQECAAAAASAGDTWGSGVGRFYVSPTRGDAAKLKENNKAAIADLAAHEGFPGHDWHYKVMTKYRDSISPVRWLTPGEVEGSSSMWEDSMAAEGWALYAEQLMAEPQPKDPEGFYTPEERVYQIQGRLYRDLRVRIDIGIHTGRMSFDEAVDAFSEVVDFLPGSCRSMGGGPRQPGEDARATPPGAPSSPLLQSPPRPSRTAWARSASWPCPGRADPPQPGHDQEVPPLFMRQGTIPPGYFEEQLLAEMKEPAAAPEAR